MPKPQVTNVSVSNGNLVIAGSGGPANGSYSVVTNSTLGAPLSQWGVAATGTFGGIGSFTVTNAIVPGTSNLFYRIRIP